MENKKIIYASFSKRLLSNILDTAVPVFIALISWAILVFVSKEQDSFETFDRLNTFFGLIVALFTFFLYFFRGKSVGRYILGLRVAKMDNTEEKPKTSSLLWRFFYKAILPGIVFTIFFFITIMPFIAYFVIAVPNVVTDLDGTHVFMIAIFSLFLFTVTILVLNIVYYAIMLIPFFKDDKKQMMYDKWAKTVVVDEKNIKNTNIILLYVLCIILYAIFQIISLSNRIEEFEKVKEYNNQVLQENTGQESLYLYDEDSYDDYSFDIEEGEGFIDFDPELFLNDSDNTFE